MYANLASHTEVAAAAGSRLAASLAASFLSFLAASPARSLAHSHLLCLLQMGRPILARSLARTLSLPPPSSSIRPLPLSGGVGELDGAKAHAAIERQQLKSGRLLGYVYTYYAVHYYSAKQASKRRRRQRLLPPAGYARERGRESETESIESAPLERASERTNERAQIGEQTPSVSRPFLRQTHSIAS